ncbi:MAG: hypothetical protein Q9186_003024 [Xanthomendoza sp. 1 TL-2023]
MSSFLCPRVSAIGTVLQPMKLSSRPISRCLDHLSNQTRHQRRPPSSSNCRTFTSSSSRCAYETVEQARSRQQTGPFSARSAVLFITAGAGMWLYFRYEKERLERKKIADMSKGVGKPKVGGVFEMKDQEGRTWTEQNIKGGFTLVYLVLPRKWTISVLTLAAQVYFGFTHCPDICPEELDKMSRIIDLLNGPPTPLTAPIPPPPIPSDPTIPVSPNPTVSPTTTAPISPTPRPPILPLFISCDPARDTPTVLKQYLSEFHPSLVGLTGTWQQVKDMCRAYRVYFSTPEGVKPGQDYLVDHSIYFYVMDPDGDFIECIGRQHTPESGAKIIKEHMSDWKNGVKFN